jgi:predicted TIM-barrel fold metal-dependent hydrolase
VIVIDSHQHIGSIGNVFGLSVSEHLSADADATDRRTTMTQLGITHAIVQPGFHYSTSRGEQEVRDVNDAIADYVRRHEFAVAGLAVVDPSVTRDPAAEANRAITDLGLAGLTFHSRFQRIPVNAPPILEAIDACPLNTRVIGVHCVAESALEAPWRLELLLETFPQRTFVAMSSLTGNSQCEEMVQLCRRYKNLYLDTSGILPLGLWVERIIKVVGSERLLYGTDMYLNPPLFRHNYALQAVMAADIDDDARTNIFSRNAARLYGLAF